MKNSDSGQPTKLNNKLNNNNQMTKNLFTVDSLLKSAGTQNSCESAERNDLSNEKREDAAKEDETLVDEFDEEKSMRSDSEELNVDKEEDDESLGDPNCDNQFARQSEADQQADRRLNQQRIQNSSPPFKNNFKSIEELYKSSLISHSNQLNGQANQAHNQAHNQVPNQQQFNNKPATNNSLLPSPSSAFLSNLSFSNHNPHFQALLASHLTPYSAFNAAFNSNPLYLNNLIHHQGNLDNAAACQAGQQQAQQQTAALNQHPLQQSSSASSPLLPKPAGPTSSGYSAVLEDNLRQALLAAQSNPVNPDNTTSKQGHSLNLISSSFNNHSGWWLF